MTLLIDELDDAGVLTHTLNRPEQFNALSEALLDALQQALDGIDDSARLVVTACGHG